MAGQRREVWITGAGLVSSLGEGFDAHRAAIAEGRAPVLQTEAFAPYTVHPLPPLDFDRQIAKKLDQRQMETWQRLGTYAAGLALDSAGLKGDGERLAETQMIVAAGGGERDTAVDSAIVTGLREATDKGRYLNERLMSDLRPTLFLAQLSNLLAGNIAIVHGVIGASRTFMGEESAGVDALRIAHARIAADQGDIFLVGGAHSAERWDLLLHCELGGRNRTGPWRRVFERNETPGLHLGSVGAFLVAEAEGHAEARGAKGLAHIAYVASDRARRSPGSVHDCLVRLWSGMADKLRPGRFAVVSCATGCAPVTAEEGEALKRLAPGAPVLAIGDLIGHGVEAQFSAATLIGLMALDGGPPGERWPGGIDQVVITSVGMAHGEGVALIERLG